MFNHPRVLVYYFLPFLVVNNADIIVRVGVGNTFRLLLTPNSLDNPINCTLLRSGTTITIIPPPVTDENDTQTQDDRIVPFGSDLCGARVHNAAFADNGLWTLTLTNATSSVSESYRVTPIFVEEPVNRTSTAAVGATSVTILCGPETMLYCDLKDPLGNDAPVSSTSRCSTVIQVVKPTDFGIWTCTVGVSGSMKEIHGTHTLDIADPLEEVVIFANETSFGKVITWQVKRIVSTASWCRVFPPNGITILVASGLEDDKYISFGTDLSQRKCGLLIRGEFLEEYNGLWRLEIGINNIRTIGGFIKMPEGITPGPNDLSATALQKKEVKVASGEPFTITCQTQYSAGYCWIQGPKGQIETSTNELNVGRCSYTINNAVLAEHNGTWKCNMAHVNGGKEDHLETEVTVLEKLYQAVNPEIKVFHGDRTVVACRSVFLHPLQYCRFVRPDGVGLGVKPGMVPTERYSYEGPGLDHGYCGLAISPVETVDLGNWTCVSRIRVHISDAEHFDLIALEMFETSTAAVIGMVFGIMILAVFVSGTLLVVYRRKRLRNEEATRMVEM